MRKGQSQNFNSRIYSSSNNNRENQNLDFKSMYYDTSDEKSKAEFVKDLIAFANFSRRTGEECFIAFGYDEKRNDLINLYGYSPGCKSQSSIGIENIDKFMTNAVEKTFADISLSHIHPESPEFSLEYGYINDVFVSYLSIKPLRTKKCFYLSKSIGRWKKGDSFYRKNASCVKINPEIINEIPAYSSIAYLGRDDWTQLITSYTSDEYYQLNMKDDLIKISVMRDDNKVLEFEDLEEQLTRHKRLMIEAPAGYGKSIFLRRFAYYLGSKYQSCSGGEKFLMDDTVEDMDSNIEKLEYVPHERIPIFMSLRGAYKSLIDFEERLTLTINEHLSNKKPITGPMGFLTIPDSKWVLLLDGFDEIDCNSRLLNLFCNWIKQLPENVWIVLTSRPYYGYLRNYFNCVKMETIKLKDGLNYLKRNISKDYYRYIEEFINSEPRSDGWKKLMTWPRALGGIVSGLGISSGEVKDFQDKDSLSRIGIDDQIKSVDDEKVGQISKDELSFLTSFVDDLLLEQGATLDFDSNPNSDSFLEQKPSEAKVLMMIIDYILNEENKRIKHPLDTLINIRRKLAKAAWELPWSGQAHPYEIINQFVGKNYVTISERLGLIEALGAYKYSYHPTYLQYYFAAEYGAHLDKDTKIKTKIHHNQQYESEVNTVVRLLEELKMEQNLSIQS